MRIMLVGGGSGGHFYPLIATAEALRAREAELGTEINIFYIGPDIFDESALGRLSISFVRCPAGKVRRYFSLRNILDFFKTMYGCVVAVYQLFYIYPDVVFSKGSYTSVPVVLAAWLLRIPIVIHESDAVPGRANRFARKFARYIGIAYPEAAEFFDSKKTSLTGIPLRQVFYEEPNTKGLREQKIIPGDPYILCVTGSLGASRLNNFILNVLNEILPHYQIVHQAGSAHADLMIQTADLLIENKDLRDRYHVFGNVPGEEFHSLQSHATLIVSRAGSSMISEIAFHQKPAILVPIPEEISHDQRTNAFAYARRGAAIVMEERNLTENLLVAEIERIMQDENLRESMKQGAASFFIPHAEYSLADIIISIAEEHAS